MPLAEMSPEAITEEGKKMASDLYIQMTQGGISKHIIAILAKAGFTTTKMFQCFGSTMDGVAKTCKLMGIDGETSLEAFADVARLQCVWSAVKAFQTADDQDHADKRVLGMTRQIKPADYTVLRHQYEKAHGKQKDRELPGSTILDVMERELEGGEFTAPRLRDLPSKQEVQVAEAARTDNLGVSALVLTTSGARLSQSVKVKIPPIADSEEMRTRLNLLEKAVEFTQIKNPAVTVLESAKKEMWQDHKDYVLGPEVRLKEVKNQKQVVVHRPSWELVVHFEHALRERAAELMNEGHDANGNKPMDIATAMQTARKCQETRKEHFLDMLHFEILSPVGSSIEAPRSEAGIGKRKRKEKNNRNKPDEEQDQPSKAKKGKGKGKSNGKGKLPDGVKLATKHNGKGICFRYGDGTCKGCELLHICQVCFKEHPWRECGKIA